MMEWSGPSLLLECLFLTAREEDTSQAPRLALVYGIMNLPNFEHKVED